jgi:DNA invertase Pin-like site-specific DNA recombinase
MPRYGYVPGGGRARERAAERTALKAAGCEVIHAERGGGDAALQRLLDLLRAGDTLMVTRIDRLARSLEELRAITATLRGKGVALRTAEPSVDAVLDVLAAVEAPRRRARTGPDRGRRPSIDAAEVIRLAREEGLGATAIARRLGIARASVYRLLGKPP